MTLLRVTWHLSGRAGIPTQISGYRGCAGETWLLQNTELGHCKPTAGSLLILKGSACLAHLLCFNVFILFPLQAQSWATLCLLQSALPWLLSMYTATNNLFSYSQRKPNLHFPPIYIGPLKLSLQGFSVKAADYLLKFIRNEGWRWGACPSLVSKEFLRHL